MRIVNERRKVLGVPTHHRSRPSAPLQGDVIGLTLLVEFPDEPAAISREEIQDLMNASGYNGFNNNGSVHDYYFDVSNGLLNYTNVVTEYWMSPRPKSDYDTTSPVAAPRDLLQAALQALDDSGFDYTSLSTTEENRIVAINLLYAGVPEAGWGQGRRPLRIKFLAVQG